jgi:hypothetical protein
MTLAKERNHTELEKFFADHLGQIHKDSGTLFAPHSSFLGTAPATVPDQVASDKEQDQTKRQLEMSEFSNVCEKQSASCGLKRSRVSSQEATAAAPDLKSLTNRSHRLDQSKFSDLVFTSLSDAIRLWEDTRDENVRNSLPKFNILATVIKWSEPKATKGLNSFKTYNIGN